MGLPQRIQSVISIEEATVQLTAALEKELDKGYMSSYGRDYLFDMYEQRVSQRQRHAPVRL